MLMYFFNKFYNFIISFQLFLLKHKKRYVPGYFYLSGKFLRYHDSWSFYHSYISIFIDGVYRIKFDTHTPIILDCGSNLGLLSLYLKRMYPKSKILSIEADSKILEFQKYNILKFGLSDIIFINAAVSSNSGSLYFYAEGGLSGRIVNNNNVDGRIVNSFDLNSILIKKIDFLKLDIEGAEFDVVFSLKSNIKNVKYLFIEYHGAKNEKQNFHVLLDFLANSGFRYQIFNSINYKSPFISVPIIEGFDFLVNIFAINEHFEVIR